MDSGNIVCSLMKRFGPHPQTAIAENRPWQCFHSGLELGHMVIGHLPGHDRQIKKLKTERPGCRLKQGMVVMSPAILIVWPVAYDTFETGRFNLRQVIYIDLRAGRKVVVNSGKWFH
jgi:hypothetical protein